MRLFASLRGACRALPARRLAALAVFVSALLLASSLDAPPAFSGGPLGSPGTDLPLNGWNEPALAVNPTNPMQLAYASLYELRVSNDGGTTWEGQVPPEYPFNPTMHGDPVVAYDAAGRLFWIYIGAQLGDTWFLSFGTDIFIAQCDPATGAILPGYPVSVTAAAGRPGNAGNNNDKPWLA